MRERASEDKWVGYIHIIVVVSFDSDVGVLLALMYLYYEACALFPLLCSNVGFSNTLYRLGVKRVALLLLIKMDNHIVDLFL